MINFTELFSCNQTEIYEKSNNDKKYLDTTKLSVLIDSEGNLLLIMGKICYGVTKETKAQFYLYENNNGQFMILDLQNRIHGDYQLLVKENADLLVACLTDKCSVTAKQKEVKKEQNLRRKDLPDKKMQNKEQKDDIQIGIPLTQNDNKYVQISKSLGTGMYMIGKFISKGITTVGDFMAKNVEPSKEIKFSQNTKQNLKQMNQFTGKVFDLASGAVKKLVNYGKQVAIDAANQNDPANRVEEQKVFTDLKNGTVTGLKVFINLYDGMVEAGDQVKDGAFKAGGLIVKKKYGLQAQQALRHVAGGVNNVMKVYKLPKNSVNYLFKVEKQQNKK